MQWGRKHQNEFASQKFLYNNCLWAGAWRYQCDLMRIICCLNQMIIALIFVVQNYSFLGFRELFCVLSTRWFLVLDINLASEWGYMIYYFSWNTNAKAGDRNFKRLCILIPPEIWNFWAWLSRPLWCWYYMSEKLIWPSNIRTWSVRWCFINLSVPGKKTDLLFLVNQYYQIWRTPKIEWNFWSKSEKKQVIP